MWCCEWWDSSRPNGRCCQLPPNEECPYPNYGGCCEETLEDFDDEQLALEQDLQMDRDHQCEDDYSGVP